MKEKTLAPTSEQWKTQRIEILEANAKKDALLIEELEEKLKDVGSLVYALRHIL